MTSTDLQGVRFRRGVRGYAVREVDAVAAHVGETLEGLAWAQRAQAAGFPGNDLPPYYLTPDDVEEVQFHRATGGYDYRDVDAYLDQAQRTIALASLELGAFPTGRPRPLVGRLRLPPGQAGLGLAGSIRGYAAAAVEGFLGRAAGTLDRLEAARSARDHRCDAPGLPPHLLTAEDVRSAEFAEVHPGYDVTEVDELLDEIEHTIVHYHHELRIEF